MNVVANNEILSFLKKISIFKLDLGDNLKGPVQKNNKNDDVNKFKIKDLFIKKYENINKTIIYKYGDIGKLKFYIDMKLPKDDIHIYDEDKLFEFKFTSEDKLKEPSQYLSELLKVVEQGEENLTETIDMIKNVTYTNAPKEVQLPDPSLPKDQYIEEVIKRRKILQNQKRILNNE